MEYNSIYHIARFWIGNVAPHEELKDFVEQFITQFGSIYWLGDEEYEERQMWDEEVWLFVYETFWTFAGEPEEGSDEMTQIDNHAEEFLEAVEEFMTAKIDEFWTSIRGF
jgi:hypothetical protein